MKKAQSKERMLFLVGTIVIFLLAIVFIVRMISPSAESSREGQAMAVANFVTISANTLSTMDAGRMQKDFGLSKPLLLEIYNKNGASYVKVTYDENGSKFYEVPLLVNVDAAAPSRVNMIYVLKDQGGKIQIKGDLKSTDLTPSGDVIPCAQLSLADINSQITSAFSAAVNKYPKLKGMDKWDQNLIKAVIMKESSFLQCRNDGTYVVSKTGAIGLMQLMPNTVPDKYSKNPVENINWGVDYLAKQVSDFGTVELGLAAYNCGPSCVQKRLQFGSWYDAQTNYPEETGKYVPLVLAYRDCYSKGCAGCSCIPQGACVLC
jgi:hypothetical protein